MDAFLKDFKLGLRALVKKPASSLVAIVAFGLGIGLCATMFSMIYGFFGSLFIVFGIAALFLASVGLYGVLAFSVSRRVQEMGLRMALGARARDVIGLVVREGAVQLGIGLTLGLSLAFAVTKIVMLIMFDVEPRDPTVLATTVITILLVGLVASLVPALRATRVDPGVALRYE